MINIILKQKKNLNMQKRKKAFIAQVVKRKQIIKT